MSITTQVSPDAKALTIKISGRFDFNLHKNFRDAYKQAGEPAERIVIDLHGTEYMDSSALGMLLVLRDRCGGEKSKISIVNCSPEIMRIFSISNMDRMFDIA